MNHDFHALLKREDNYTRVPNKFLEMTAMSTFTAGEHKVLDVILRHTYGYHRKMSYLSFTMLTEKTKLSRRYIAKILKRLKNSGVIIITKSGNRNVIGINRMHTGELVDNLSSGVTGVHRQIDLQFTI